MTLAEIEDLIVRLLAEDAGRDPQEFRMELEAAGEMMPVDSLLAAEVLVRVQIATGVGDLPATAETSRALRSVRTFAAAVWDLLGEHGVAGGASA